MLRIVRGGVLAEFVDCEFIENAFACRFEHNRRRVAGLPGFDPPRETDTPAVARMQPREVEFRPWGDEIVALLAAVFEKRLCHHRTDLVATRIALEVSTVAIPQKPGFWTLTTGL